MRAHHLLCFGCSCFALLASLTTTGAQVDRKPPMILKDSSQFREYQIRVYENTDTEGAVEIIRNGRPPLRIEGTQFKIGMQMSAADMKQDNPSINAVDIKPGDDLNGNGVPDLIISEWTGGAHCCSIIHLIELGPTPTKLASIDAEHSGYAHFEKDPAMPAVLLTMQDWTYAYWPSSFAGSPSPTIYLTMETGEPRLALERMRRPAPLLSETADLVTKLHNSPDWKTDELQPPTDFLQAVLDLVYSGNEKAAWYVFDHAWNSRKISREKFKREFKQKIASSKYWPEIQRLNGR